MPDNNDLEVELLTVDQAAELMQVSPYTIRAWIASGDLTARRVGPKPLIRIHRADLLSLGQATPGRAS